MENLKSKYIDLSFVNQKKEELLNKDIINYESITGMSLLEIFNKEGKYFEDKIYNK